MTRFASPTEVLAWADAAAWSDWQRHSVVHVEKDGNIWQCSANPYSTHTRRHDWQRGYDNSPAYSWGGTLAYDTAYQRGAAYRRLEEKYASLNVLVATEL